MFTKYVDILEFKARAEITTTPLAYVQNKIRKFNAWQ